jgi:hypothetical protein
LVRGRENGWEVVVGREVAGADWEWVVAGMEVGAVEGEESGDGD